MFLLAIYYSLSVIQMILFLRILLSWFRVNQNNKLVLLLYSLTDPILMPIQKLVEASIFGGRKGGIILDISPLIAFIFLQLAQSYIMNIMR